MLDLITLATEAVKFAEKVRDLEFKEKMHALRKRALELQEENDVLKRRLQAKDEMTPTGPLNYFYKKEYPDKPHCPACWQKDERAVLLPALEKFAAGTGRKCHVCKAVFIEKAAEPPRPSIAIGKWG